MTVSQAFELLKNKEGLTEAAIEKILEDVWEAGYVSGHGDGWESRDVHE